MEFKEGIYIRGKQVKIYGRQDHKHIIFDGTKAKYTNELGKMLAKASNGGTLPYAIKTMTGDYFIEKEIGKYELKLALDVGSIYVDAVYKSLKSRLRKGLEMTDEFIQSVVKDNIIPEEERARKNAEANV